MPETCFRVSYFCLRIPRAKNEQQQQKNQTKMKQKKRNRVPGVKHQNNEHTAFLVFTVISPMLPMTFLTDCRGRCVYIPQWKKEISVGCFSEIMLHNSFSHSSQYDDCFRCSSSKNPTSSNPISATNA